MSITTHALWPMLRQYFTVELTTRESARPRVRIELKKLPPELSVVALTMWMPCVCCSAPIHPIRARHGKNLRSETKGQNFFFAATCPLEVCLPCSRGMAARAEYLAIQAALLAPMPAQLELSEVAT